MASYQGCQLWKLIHIYICIYNYIYIHRKRILMRSPLVVVWEGNSPPTKGQVRLTGGGVSGIWRHDILPGMSAMELYITSYIYLSFVRNWIVFWALRGLCMNLYWGGAPNPPPLENMHRKKIAGQGLTIHKTKLTALMISLSIYLYYMCIYLTNALDLVWLPERQDSSGKDSFATNRSKPRELSTTANLYLSTAGPESS